MCSVFRVALFPRMLAGALAFLGLCWAPGCGAEHGTLGTLLVVAGDGVGGAVSPLPRPVAGGLDASVAAWVFVSEDCPIARAYMPEIESIAQDFRGRGVCVLVVHVDPQITPARASAHARQYGVSAPVVVDCDHRLVRHCGATVTPEAAVFDSSGSLRYLGRIDDRFPALGSRRAPTTSELRDALEAVLSEEDPDVARAPSVGCLIEELRQ